MFNNTDDTLASLEEVGYFTTREIANTIYLAGELNRPILLEGPAGAGKTEMALAINRATGSYVCSATKASLTKKQSAVSVMNCVNCMCVFMMALLMKPQRGSQTAPSI
jgi:MoxR-like ATPase